jgi:ribosome-associated protein
MARICTAATEEVYSSRTARKEAVHAITDLAHQIAELPEATFRRLQLNDETREAFVVARSLKASSARARQLRHLGALLREDEEMLAGIRQTLEGNDQRQLADNKLFHDLEGLRDRLLLAESSAAALDEARTAFPALDHAALKNALAQHRKDGDKKAFRTIFRLLRDAAAKVSV